jgi:hypothetical protein
MSMQTDVFNVVNPPEGGVGALAGWPSLAGELRGQIRSRQGQRAYRIGVDGYVGIDWERVSACVLRAFEEGSQDGAVRVVSAASYMKSEDELSALYEPYIGEDDPYFGKVFRQGIGHLFSAAMAKELRDAIRPADLAGRRISVIVCVGRGALLPAFRGLYDYRIYLDMTREKAARSGLLSGGDESAVNNSKRSYYIDFPVHDEHRKRVVATVDRYADGSAPENPVFVPLLGLRHALKEISTLPFRAKPIYESGIWGGQWLIRKRGIQGLKNCAYGLEIIAPAQSVLVRMGGVELDLPFNLIKDAHMSNLMEARTIRKFGGEFPIRYAYDDTWEGGDLSVQVHPTTGYIKESFGERLHQAESYYILDAKPGAIVHLGLQEGIDREKFLSEMLRSERENVTLDHTRFVKVHQAKKGALFLIPPGTVHGAGANEIVLEISTTPYRYTFKIYDYRRPDINGTFRPLSLGHAFKVIKFFRQGPWVEENLIAKPRLVRSGGGFSEFSLLDRKDCHHAITRVEFEKRYDDTTRDRFHMLNLVDGDCAAIRRRGDGKDLRTFAFSETVLIPFAFGDYDVVNLGTTRCAVLKSFIR